MKHYVTTPSLALLLLELTLYISTRACSRPLEMMVTALEKDDNTKDYTLETKDVLGQNTKMWRKVHSNLTAWTPSPGATDEPSHTDDGRCILTAEPRREPGLRGTYQEEGPMIVDTCQGEVQGLRGVEPRWTVQQRSCQESRPWGASRFRMTSVKIKTSSSSPRWQCGVMQCGTSARVQSTFRSRKYLLRMELTKRESVSTQHPKKTQPLSPSRPSLGKKAPRSRTIIVYLSFHLQFFI